MVKSAVYLYRIQFCTKVSALWRSPGTFPEFDAQRVPIMNLRQG